MTTPHDEHARTPEDPTPDAAGAADSDEVPGASDGVPGASDGVPAADAPVTAAAVTAPRDGSALAQPRGTRGLWIAAGAAVLAVVAVVVVIVSTQRDEPVAAPTTPPAVTLTNPLPTPAATPAERARKSPLEKVFPDTVLQWAVATQERTTVAKEPLESYRLTYTDGAGGTITVDVVQTRTAEDAAEVVRQLADDAPPLSEGATVTEEPVLVGENQVGTASVATGDEVGVASWTNGTTALRATGPGAAIENFFLAFPL